MTAKILVVAEGSSDFRRIVAILDNWIVSVAAWADGQLDVARTWTGLSDEDSWIKIKTIPQAFRKVFPPMYGSPHGGGDRGTLRKLGLLLRHHRFDGAAVVWVRDMDTARTREAAAKAAVHDMPQNIQPLLLLALANQCGEAWVLAGVPEDDSDGRHREFTARTGRRLPRDAHQLSHKENVEGNAKRAIEHFGLDDFAAESDALRRAMEKGHEQCGIAAFREALHRHVGLRTALGVTG